MVDGRSVCLPSDGLLRLPRTVAPFGILGAATRLAGSSLSFCYPGGEAEFATPAHEEQVRRFWEPELISGQQGRVSTMSKDLAICFNKFRSGDTSGPTHIPPRAGCQTGNAARPAFVPLGLPANFKSRGSIFFATMFRSAKRHQSRRQVLHG